jgi:hypothetical protein
LIYEYGDRYADLALDDTPIARPSSLDLWTASYRRYRAELLASHGIEP